METQAFIHTGQRHCYDSLGRPVNCAGSGQDAEFGRGVSWPEPRFEIREGVVRDRLTGLTWSRNASLFEFPVDWNEAFHLVMEMNREGALGFSDWRVPDRRELRSLLSHETTRPPLPEGHPFHGVNQTLYWTASTAAIHTASAWYVHMGGGRAFYAGKRQFGLVWPVRGRRSSVVPDTGQKTCYDTNGRESSCPDTGQPVEVSIGAIGPHPRFAIGSDGVTDSRTGLCWHRSADITGGMVDWAGALEAVDALNASAHGAWRLPNINELESLVDLSAHSPALPAGHPFTDVREEYWSSTTSVFEPDWAWCLYLHKGAVGVGWKRGREFHVWPVRDPTESAK